MAFSLPNIELGLAAAKSYPGIQIAPIIAKDQHQTQIHKFLWEGIADKAIEIKEHQSNSVPKVTIVNRSKEQFLGYRGSVIRGGGQNRQLVHSFVIPEGATLDIPVQCIQHGRWNPQQNKEFSNKKGDITSSSLRFSKKTQQETWHTIQETTSLTGTSSRTQDYTVTYDTIIGDMREMTQASSQIAGQKVDKKRDLSRQRAQEILKDLNEPVPNQIGIYVSMLDPFEWKSGNLRIIRCMELFVSPELYSKVHKDLVSSFAMDAALLPQDEISQHFYEEKVTSQSSLNHFSQMVQKAASASWKDNDNIGTESRREVSEVNQFGEIVSQGDEMLHMMYSEYELSQAK